jgi:hypothetical protein
MGIDYKVCLCFKCDQSTIERIIQKNGMTRDSTAGGGLGFTHNLIWWDEDKMDNIVPYKYTIENEYYEYLWYDAASTTAFYQEYSL